MKKILHLLCGTMLSTALSLNAQVNIVVSPDSVYKEDYATEPEIAPPSYITNNSGSTVTIRWTRVVEQESQGWDHAFCDKNLCYLGTVGTKTFELINREEGLLKPIFYPHEITGIGVMRLYYASETSGVSWSDTAVYVAVATELVGSVEAELVRDIAIFPSPASDMLTVVTSDANLQGQWSITDPAGKVWCHSKIGTTYIAGQISITELPVGLYCLHVLTLDGRHATVKRFVVQR